MKEYKLNLDDIEEVESTPRRRHRHNHSHNHGEHRTTNAQYENNRSYHQNNYNNRNNAIENNNEINRNYRENNRNDDDRHHHRRNQRPQWYEFGFKQVLLMTVFSGSIIVLALSFIVNLVLTIKQVITPRFFLPSIVLIVLSFTFAGGILGTYIIPPNGRVHRPRFKELLLMRTLIPIIMLIVSLIFLLIGGDNIKSLKNNIMKAENLCKENKGLSMEEIYIKSNETLSKLMTLKNDMIYSFQNNLNCFPDAKCFKLTKDENNYICNSKNFIDKESINIKCEIIDFNNKTNQHFNNLNNQKNANLFLENCLDINKNFLKTNDNLFICESEYNLENIKFTQNLTKINDFKIESYLKEKEIKLNIEIRKNREITNKYENSRYNYDLECLRKPDYNISYLIFFVYLS